MKYSKGYYHIIASNNKDYCNGLYHSWNNERIYTNKLYRYTVKKHSLFGFILWLYFKITIRDDKK